MLMTDKGFLSDYGNKIKIEHSSGISVMYNTHLHPQYELYFCPDNIEQESVINGQKYRYCYPCAILSRPYTVHSMSCMEKSGTRFERFVFYFSEDTLAHLSGNLLPERWQSADTGLLFRLTPEQGVYLRDCLRQFLSGGQAPTVREKELIFGFLMNRLYSFCSDDCITEVDTSFFYIQGVLRYVAENLSEELDVERLAAELLQELLTLCPENVTKRYAKLAIGTPLDEILLRVAESRAFLLSGGELDTERAARVVLDEFRAGKIGRITLERPERRSGAAEEEKKETESHGKDF